MQDLVTFLEKRQLGGYYDKLVKAGFSVPADFLEFTSQDLEEWGESVGMTMLEKKKLRNLVHELRSEFPASNLPEEKKLDAAIQDMEMTEQDPEMENTVWQSLLADTGDPSTHASSSKPAVLRLAVTEPMKQHETKSIPIQALAAFGIRRRLTQNPPTIKQPIMATRAQEICMEVGGSFVAMHAGYINMVVLLRLNVNIGNQTGNVARLGQALADCTSPGTEHIKWPFLLIQLISFVAGSAVSSMVTGKGHKYKFTLKFGIVLVVESLFLLLAFLCWEVFPDNHIAVLIAPYFLAFSLGLQNGIATHFSGAIVRTTHLTGVLTDIGGEIGTWFRFATRRWRGKQQHHFEPWKLKMMTLLLVFYFVGAFLASLAFKYLAGLDLIFPFVGFFLFSMLYMILLHQGFFEAAAQPRATSRQLDEQQLLPLPAQHGRKAA